MTQQTGHSTGEARVELYHGWFRVFRLPRQRRKPWVRVTQSPVTRDVAIELAHRMADREGGGDVYAGTVDIDPNRVEGMRDA